METKRVLNSVPEEEQPTAPTRFSTHQRVPAVGDAVPSTGLLTGLNAEKVTMNNGGLPRVASRGGSTAASGSSSSTSSSSGSGESSLKSHGNNNPTVHAQPVSSSGCPFSGGAGVPHRSRMSEVRDEASTSAVAAMAHSPTRSSPGRSIRRLSRMSEDEPASPGKMGSDESGQTVGSPSATSRRAKFGLGPKASSNSRLHAGTSSSDIGRGPAGDDDAACGRSDRSGSVSSDGSGDSCSTANSGMIVDSFALIDKHIRKFGGLAKITGIKDLLSNPTPDVLDVFRTRFDALFVILDAAVRLTKHPFVVMTPDCRVILASPTIVNLVGFTADELTGNNINLIIPHEIAVRHDEIVSRYVDSIAAGETERASSVVYNTRPVTARAKDGSPVSVELTVRPIMSTDTEEDTLNASTSLEQPQNPQQRRRKEVVLFVAQLRDARQEVSLKNTVKESAMLQSLFPFPYIEASEGMTILKFNPAAEKAFGISAERAIGKNVMILMPPHIRSVETKKRIRKIDHDKIVRNYVSKVRSVGEANVNSTIVNKKTRHVAQRVNTTDVRSISSETFPMELEVRMLLASNGEIKFQAFARDCESYMNAKEAEDAILKQTFPEPVAEAISAGHDVNGELELGVIFCDIVKFTALSQLISDAAALRVLDDLFTRFADIRKRMPWMDPIKTNYDEFMCVVGLSPKYQGRNLAEDAVRVARAMLEETEKYNEDTGSAIEIRVGIDVGPCQVGLVGSSGLKTFDIIGQTSVRASRAEGTCDPNHVHITDATYDRLGDTTRERFTPKRGGVVFKNMGQASTFLCSL